MESLSGQGAHKELYENENADTVGDDLPERDDPPERNDRVNVGQQDPSEAPNEAPKVRPYYT